MPSISMPGGHFWLVEYRPYMLEIDCNIGSVQEVDALAELAETIAAAGGSSPHGGSRR